MSTRSAFSLYSLLCLALVAGEIIRIPLGSNLYINLADSSSLILIFLYFYQYYRHKEHIDSPYNRWPFIIFFTMIFTIILRLPVVPLAEGLKSSMYPLRWLMYFLIPSLLIPLASLHLQRFIHYLTLSLISLTFLGIAQVVFFPNLEPLQKYGFDPHFYRLVSTWLDPNFFGLAMVFTLIFTLHLKNSLLQKILILLASIVLILTFSRSAYLTFVVAISIYAYLSRSLKALAWGAIVIFVALGIYFFPRANIEKAKNIDRTVSADLRLVSYEQAYELFKSSPWTGVGYNLIRYEKNTRGYVIDYQKGGNSGAGFDSSWLVILSTMGIIGSIIYLIFWLNLLGTAFLPKAGTLTLKALAHNVLLKQNPAQAALVAILIAWSINAWFINSLFYSIILLLWNIVFSLLYSEAKDYK